MFRIFYDFSLLIIGLLSLPKLLWDYLVHRKYRCSLAMRLGLKVPNFSIPTGDLTIWIHAVSVGETRAVSSLVETIREKIPNAAIVFSTTTETGQEEAKRVHPGLAGYFFLPLDFSWVIKRFVRKLRPDILILVESDFWYNAITSVPKAVVVNGKISERSARRFGLVPFFTKRLFAPISLFCVQSQRYADRFFRLGVEHQKIVITGNLKFDTLSLHIDKEKWQKDLGISPEDRVITLGSTHENEEEEILNALEPLAHRFSNLKILIVPRHPERFSAVAELLEKKGIAFSRFSDHAPHKKRPRIVLIDAMGILNPCYQISELAIVGGSFVSHIGGHNIFEPAVLGVPVLFGPHMQTQPDLVDIILHAGAGKQVAMKDLAATVADYLEHPPVAMRQAGLNLASEVHGATVRTWKALEPFLKS